MLKYGIDIMGRSSRMSLREFYFSIENEFKKRTVRTTDKLLSYQGCQIFNEAYGEKDEKIYIKRAHGYRLIDYDDNEYIDLAMGGGTFILGHSWPVVIENVRKQLDSGSLYTIPNFIAYDFTCLLSKTLPNMNCFVFCNSGSEATMRAIRIARAFTKKRKIGVFSGGWHGSHDMVLVDDNYLGNLQNPGIATKSSGIPDEMLELAVVLPYNHDAAFEIIKKERDELAIVLIEPAQGSNPRDDMGGFLKNLRSVTRENDVLLCFDEIINGFRIALGGGQEYYGIEADLATYGKTIGGGFPVGVVGGQEYCMKTIKEVQNGTQVFMGGTFSANPVTMLAGHTVLSHLYQNGPEIYGYLNEMGDYLKSGINSFCSENDIPIRMMGIGSMMRLVFTDYPIKSRRDRDKYEFDMAVQNHFYTALLNSGVHVGSNRINFLSVAHDRPDVDRVAGIYIDLLLKFKKAGCFERVDKQKNLSSANGRR